MRYLLPLLMLLVGCQSTGPATKVAWSADPSERRIVVGTTHQDQFEELLGKPDVVTSGSDGRTIWTFSNRTYDPETGLFAKALTIFPADSELTPDIETGYDLILHFDLHNTVSDYFLVPSQY